MPPVLLVVSAGLRYGERLWRLPSLVCGALAEPASVLAALVLTLYFVEAAIDYTVIHHKS